MGKKIKNLFLDIFFPKFCLGCGKEGSFLCQDCWALFEISGFHQRCRYPYLEDLYFPLGYHRILLKTLTQKFKYEPFARELSKPLAELIISHFLLMDIAPAFLKHKRRLIMVPIPLFQKREKWRGFNQAKELSRHLADFFRVPLVSDALVRKKETSPQVKIGGKQRYTNIIGAFECLKPEAVKKKTVLLIDDIYTTGSTMNEAARILIKSGANKVIGIVIARALPHQDSPIT